MIKRPNLQRKVTKITLKFKIQGVCSTKKKSFSSTFKNPKRAKSVHLWHSFKNAKFAIWPKWHT
jgi:hypothetical protein